MNVGAEGSSGSSSTRQSRGSIAAQACETCRSRKQKCNEERPKCSLCQRMNLDCVYREPQPTKKDRTLVEILDRLKILELKIDQIPGGGSQTSASLHSSRPSPASYPSSTTHESSASQSTQSQASFYSASKIGQPYRHTPAAHKILTWPTISQALLQYLPANIGDINDYERDGATFLVELSRSYTALTLDDGMHKLPFLGMQTPASRSTGGSRMTFPALGKTIMRDLAEAYFDTFNLVYPFMDRQHFLQNTLEKVHSEGFEGDNDSVIALLIYSLGEMAIDGSSGKPISVVNGRASGIRGGSAENPPGLALFTEARRRIGFVLTDCELENVQIYCLVGLYYQACFRHQEFWRSMVAASSACKVLISSNSTAWHTPRGDLVKRAYWHCVIMETGLNLELDLPLTGITDLEDSVGMPSFNAPFCAQDHEGNQVSFFESHYASQLALRRLCANLHNTINSSMADSATPMSNESIPSAQSLKALAQTLVQWRGMLPKELQWGEDDPAAFPAPHSPPTTDFKTTLDPGLSQTPIRNQPPLFSIKTNEEPAQYRYLYDVQVALLRSRYYYAKYIAYRPFIYKALHFPEQMSQTDAEGAAECLRACLKWPVLLSPVAQKKRMVPFLFCWSQNFLGILLIFHMTEHNPMLSEIRKHLGGARFEQEYTESVQLMLDWIHDLKDCDPIAMWCWRILRHFYA